MTLFEVIDQGPGFGRALKLLPLKVRISRGGSTPRKPRGHTLGHDPSRCRWLHQSRQSGEESPQCVVAKWWVSARLLSGWRSGFFFQPSGAVRSPRVLPPPVGRLEAPLLPRVVDPGQSHACEIIALRIELQAEPQGFGRFSEGLSRREACI